MKNKREKSPSRKDDIKLMKRLLAYALPYWKQLLLSLILLLSITGLELFNPYLIKVAIDDHINTNGKAIYQLEEKQKDAIQVEGQYYIRQDKIEDKDQANYQDLPLKKIMKDEGQYYLTDFDQEEASFGLAMSKEDYQAFRKVDLEGIKKVAILFFITIFLAFLFNYGQTLLLNYTGQKIIFNIREEVFQHILQLSVSYFDKTPIGRLVTRVNNDVETLNEMYTSVLVNLFKDLFTLAGIMIIMLRMDYKLALLSFSLIPFILIVSVIFRKKVRVVYARAREQLAQINSSLNENISAMRIIQIFNKEDKISKEFDDLNQAYLDTARKEVQLYALLRPAIEIIRSLGIAFLIYFGGSKVIKMTMDFGMLYIFIDYLQRFFNPILELTEKYNILQSSMASSERIFQLLDEDSFIENPEQALQIEDFEGKIEFKNVWFAYDEENWVLKDLSFTIEPGQTVALVGPTGAGKTSIINLITRFYDINHGQILIDGVDIRDMDKYQLRKLIGIVLQDVFLFTGSIRDNIRLNNSYISQEKVKEIAKYVNADSFIDKLTNKYDEEIMERGSSLSVGQRQLLSFARTLIYNPKILILDEATASIDTETELLIQDALGKIIKNRSTIAIAHRLSTIQDADQILVLKDGQIVERGNHQELLNKEGDYYNLYQLQYN